MSLNPEWRNRLRAWHQALVKQIYQPLDPILLSGFSTREQLDIKEARQHTFTPISPGSPWGAKWEYGWFQGRITLPEAAARKRIALKIDVGGASTVYVNGKAAGAADREHKEITLTKQGVPDTQYEVMIEGYAGHDPTPYHIGPVSPEQSPSDSVWHQATLGESTFGIWEEDLYQLRIDVETLFQVRENIDPNSLRAAEIDQGLRDFTLIVDLELEHEAMLETVRACRKRLAPLLACVNGSTAPTMYAFGHAHIDVAWLWPLAETERKCVRTFSNQLALMEEYPEFKFLQSQPHLYNMVKTHYPQLYEHIKKAIASGQWLAEGGTWVEPDTNLTGGESLIRQFIHGKRFYREEFGIECELLRLPDVFGYSGALPQIMRGCGIKYFSTQKIFWAYNSNTTFPYNTFIWEGIDGSEILVHLHNDYNSHTNPASVITHWDFRVLSFSTENLSSR
jgi:alpha-mannosidase